MTRREDAIAATEADWAFAPLERFDRLLLAVSGGADSMALLYLLADWRARLATPPQVSVATVDHCLRPASAREAAFVAEHAAALGLSHATLKWDGDKPQHGIPNAARVARYALLDAHARDLSESGTIAVVTAHHQDDQAETVFMRLARGGGVDALAAMSPDRALHAGSPVRLARPLLAFSKARLIATLSARDIPWCEDATNIDTSFERPRVRATLEASGLDAAALATTARRMTDAREALDYAARHFQATLGLDLHGGIYARFDRAAFNAGPIALRQMMLIRLIGYFGGATAKPEVSEIEALALRLSDDNETAATLGGAVVSAGRRYIRVWREPGRLTVSALHLTSGRHEVWDNRFRAGVEGTTSAPVTVLPLGHDGAALANAGAAKIHCPSGAAYGLPAFFSDGVLLAVPQLDLLTADARKMTFTSTPLLGSLGGIE